MEKKTFSYIGSVLKWLTYLISVSPYGSLILFPGRKIVHQSKVSKVTALQSTGHSGHC